MHERGNGDETVSRSARLAERVWFPVSPGRGDEASPDGLRAEGDSAYSVDARGAMGVQVGDGNTQIIYAYGQLTWTDGVAPPPLVSRSGVVDSPYRGLGAFEERDAGFFFGREDAVAQVLERMSRLLARGGLLVVSGASGAGKSSLLRAGVLPRLRGAGLAGAPGAASWPCLVFAPGRAPLDELAVRTALLAGTDAAAVRRGLTADPGGFALTARQAALARPPAPGGESAAAAAQEPGRRLLLVVDQFEQVFTQCADEAQRQAFITALCAAAGAGNGGEVVPGALVVLGVRADFEARCAGYPELAGAVQDRYLVTPMTGRQLRLAITGPARAVGSHADDDLAEALLAQVRSRQTGSAGAGVLPLLSHALDQAWRSRAGKALTLADYERTGGIEGAVAVSAERAYRRLAPGPQTAARQVFARLTATSPHGADTADRATRAELTEGKTLEQAADVEAVLEAFAAERLLTLAADSVEISHEALLTAWPLLRDTWLAQTHADRITRTRLRGTAAEWERSGDASYLYRGTLLRAAAEMASRTAADPGRNPPLGQAERDFLRASSSARDRAARWRQAAVAGLAVLALAAAVTAGVAVHVAGIAARNATDAAQQHAVALSRQLAAESLSVDGTDPVTARQLAVAAWAVSNTSQAGSAMTTLLAEQRQQGMLPVTNAGAGVDQVAFSPDGKLLAAANLETIQLWDPATGRPAGSPIRAAPGTDDVIWGMAFSPDGRLLATVSGGGTVRFWNPATGRPARSPIRADTDPDDIGSAIAFSPDGKLLATATDNGRVRLWNLATGRPVRGPIPVSRGGYVPQVAFSPDGKLLATADGDGTVRLWHVATGRPAGGPLPTYAGPDVGPSAVAFSPDGRLLATIDENGTVRLWNPVTGRPAGGPLAVGVDQGAGASAVAFSPDGRLLATAGRSGTVRLWNPATGRPVGESLPADTSTDGGVQGLAFSPDGHLLATADENGTVRLWDPTTGRPAGSPLQADTRPDGRVDAVAFGRGGTLVAAADDLGVVRWWDTVTGRLGGAPFRAEAGADGGVEGAAFSPDAGLLAVAYDDDTVRLWNLATGRPAGVRLRAASGPGDDVWAMAISPDGKLLATADSDGAVRLWDPVTGRPVGHTLLAKAGAGDAVDAVAFSPDGRLLAAAGSDLGLDATVQLWNPATGRSVGEPLPADAGPDAIVTAVAFSPDGRLLAAAGEQGTVRLWNLAAGRPVGTTFQADASPTGSVNDLAFSPDGKLLATADSDVQNGGTVRLWNAATGRPVGFPVPADAGTDGSVNALAFSPDGKLLATADFDDAAGGTVQTWDVGLFTNPYAALCTEVGPPTREAWALYAPGERFPDICR